MSSNATLQQAGFWMLLGWYDILSRYRSTVLGVLWIVIINAFTIGAIGFVYSSLFGIALENYFPYLTTGYIFWLFINSSLLEISGSLAAYRFILHSHPVAPILVLLRVFVRNFIILLHNVPIMLAVLLLYGPGFGPEFMLIVPGLFLLSVILVCGSGILAFMCARFADVQMIINAAVGVLFLITPIIWSPDILKERAYIAYVNPLSHMLDIVRGPLLGQVPTATNYLVSAGVAVVCMVVFLVVYRVFRKRYVFWL